MEKDDDLKAKVGQKYLIKFSQAPFPSKIPKDKWDRGVIAPSCGNDSPHTGHWACITHHVIFGNQLNKDGHINEGNHQLAWWCPKCVAYETP